MTKPAKVKVRVSTQPVVVMEAEVARKIRQHSRTSMKAEVCGVLIGNTEHERMTVEACIPGVNAAQGGAHVTFTQDTWEHIYKIKDKEYPDAKIVGWYHSHPGFGVFLSEHDLFIQQNFFSNPQQVAWVYDPHTDEEGCFGWVGGSIEKLSAIRVGYSQSVEITNAGTNDYEEQESVAADLGPRPPHGEHEEPPWLRWTSLALGYLAIALLGFVGGFMFRDRQLAPVVGTFRQAAENYQLILEHRVEACSQLLQVDLRTILAAQSAGAAAPAPKQSSKPPAQPEKVPAQKGNNGKH